MTTQHKLISLTLVNMMCCVCVCVYRPTMADTVLIFCYLFDLPYLTSVDFECPIYAKTRGKKTIEYEFHVVDSFLHINENDLNYIHVYHLIAFLA